MVQIKQKHLFMSTSISVNTYLSEDPFMKTQYFLLKYLVETKGLEFTYILSFTTEG